MKVKTDTIIRTIVLVLALVNQVLTSLGKNPLPFSQDEMYTGLSCIFTVVVSLITWWKNNSFTQSALIGDKVMHDMKNGLKEDNSDGENSNG